MIYIAGGNCTRHLCKKVKKSFQCLKLGKHGGDRTEIELTSLGRGIIYRLGEYIRYDFCTENSAVANILQRGTVLGKCSLCTVIVLQSRQALINPRIKIQRLDRNLEIEEVSVLLQMW